jgi:hypothetical protein
VFEQSIRLHGAHSWRELRACQDAASCIVAADVRRLTLAGTGEKVQRRKGEMAFALFHLFSSSSFLPFKTIQLEPPHVGCYDPERYAVFR